MKKLLVTGGAGFIGSNFIRYMLKKYKKYKIINLDLLSYAGNLENLIEVEANRNYKFVKGNICDKKLIEKLFANNIDIVINFAAETHVDRSINIPAIFTETNVMGTQILLDAALKYDVEKYIQISTDEVYGTLDQSGSFTEKSSLAPNNPYSASKAGADMLVRSYYKTFNLPAIITRCSNNFGPYQNTEKLMPLMITNALQDKELPVYGDGLQTRDWIFVEDHCKALKKVLDKGKTGEVYNIGANNEVRNINIIKMILDYLDKPYSLIKYVDDRPGHDRRYAVNAAKIKNELGWTPEYSLDDGLKETINWYLNNKWWW
ncbi:MAG: dTDP-glucose 4,6-dehydratase [Halothermotrichaceae bacterium]